MAWAVALNPNDEGNQYISSIDIQSQSGNSNPVWSLKFKLAAGNEVFGFYRIASESIGNVSTNRILLAADLSEIRYYRTAAPKTFSLSGVSITDEFEFVSDGNNLELLAGGVSQGVISGATGALFTNIGANFGNYSNMQLEYMEFTTTDDANLNRNYDATGSDHNSLILSDLTGNDVDGGSFNNMTTANWIDLGGGNFEVIGNVSFGISPVSIFNSDYSIAGDISFGITPNSAFAVTTTDEIIGDVSIGITPNAVFNSDYNIFGDTSLGFIVDSPFEPEYNIFGVVSLGLNSDSIFEVTETNEVTGNVTIGITPQSNFVAEYDIQGDVTLGFAPMSVFAVLTDGIYASPEAIVTYNAPSNISTYDSPSNIVRLK